jgi:RNA polymerase sigma factor (sigma-70 family)
MDEGVTVMQAQRGDVQAFGRLMEHRGPVVYRLCYAILRSRDDAEDAAQETFVSAWRELRTLRAPEAWPDWLRRIAVRKAIETDRRRRRHARGVITPTVAEDSARAVHERDAMERAFILLPIDERAILALRYYLDLDVPQAAAALGIPLGTAKSRIHRALNRLRALVEDQGPGR